MKTLRLATFLALVGLICGCSHHLEIKNLHEYHSSSLHKLPDSLSIGVSTSNTEQNGKLLVNGLANSLGKYTNQVVYPYLPVSTNKVDLVTTVAVHPDHKGSGTNFWINFPGFLIWAPAWNGYIYRPTYKVDIELLRGSDLLRLDTFSVPIVLDVRHAEMDRTWTEISWFEVGIIALIGGIAFTDYDDDVTPLLEYEIKAPIGDYLAEKIVARATSSDILRRIRQEKEPEAAPAKTP